MLNRGFRTPNLAIDIPVTPSTYDSAILNSDITPISVRVTKQSGGLLLRGLYGDNGTENGNYNGLYSDLLYWDNGKSNGKLW